MSFKKSSNSKIKSFVTEDEAQDINEKRQIEWEKVRQPDDPLGEKCFLLSVLESCVFNALLEKAQKLPLHSHV